MPRKIQLSQNITYLMYTDPNRSKTYKKLTKYTHPDTQTDPQCYRFFIKPETVFACSGCSA